MTQAASTLSVLRERLASFLGFSHEGKRDLYKAFGYPRTIMSEDFFALYSRSEIASRVIRAFPQAAWRDFPAFCDEQGETEEDSKFVASATEFVEKFGVQSALERADRLASIGRYGVLVMGFQDGDLMSRPLGSGQYPLLYLQPYAEHNISISRWDTNSASPRFGLPELYSVRTGQPTTDGQQAPSRTLVVHWSRVLHISEFLDEDEVYGQPRLKPVYNRIKDLEKVVGGSAETFWLTANRGMAYWADKDANLTEAEIATVKEQAEEFQHQLRRYVVGSGMTAQVLGSDTPDPKPNVETILDLIAGGVGIPKRILIGSERGELSSDQDEENWSSRIAERRNNFVMPKILRPFIELMIRTGNIVEPQGQWWAEWPKAGALGPAKQAEVNKIRSETLKNYMSTPGAEMIVEPNEFRTEFLGMEEMTEEMLAELEDFAIEAPVDPTSSGEDEGDDPEEPATNRRPRPIRAVN